MGALEARDLGGGGLERLGGDDGLQGGERDVPELVVRAAGEVDDSSALGVEGRGHVQDGVLEDFLDAGVGDGDGLVERVDASSNGEGLEERGGGARAGGLDGGLSGHCG